MKRSVQPRSGNRGVTITELMVAVSVLTIGVIGGMASFKYVMLGISNSRTKTIAANLAQEKMEVLKNLSYYQLLPSTSVFVNGNYTPNLTYDTGAYAPDTVSLWGQPIFTRAAYVAYASVTGNQVSTVPYTDADPGLKEIVTYVLWKKDSAYYKTELRNLIANPNAKTLDTSISGNVKNSVTTQNLPGALVQVIGSPQWQGLTDASGNYTFQVADGTYSLTCSSSGYFTQSSPQFTVYRGSPYTAPTFNMVPIATGTVSGDVWISSSLVISQVVASTGAANIEYVELFNPTTAPITIGGVSPPVLLYVGVGNGAGSGSQISLTYTNATAPASSYYLIASQSPIMISGVSRTADAVYSGGPTDQIQSNRSGGVALVRASDSAYLDRVAWSRSGGAENGPANFTEGTSIVAGPNGLDNGEQLVRMSGPGSLSSTYGRAYDTDNNAYNFFYFGSIVYGHNNTAVSMPVLSGHPAYNAFATSNDGNSISVQAVTYNPASSAYSKFTLVGVATGTWNIVVTSGTSVQTVTGVVVAQNAVTSIPNAATTPAWPATGAAELLLTSTSAGGYVQGYVYGSGAQYGTPLSGILVNAAGALTRTASNGYFLLAVDTGTVTVTANYNSDNVNYTIDAEVGTVNTGDVVFVPPSPYIHLSQGGVITGYVTQGVGALPNVVVTATLGGQTYSGTSDSTGHFAIPASTASAAYSVSPTLDPLQTYTGAPSTPLTASVTVPGSTVFAGTITVSGALGTISGNLKDGGNLITTGVLVIASTGTISDPPPTITASGAPSYGSPYYAASSQGDGTYSLSVRAGTGYNLRAYYPVVDTVSGAATYVSKTLSGITVTAGAATSGQNLTWP